LRHLRLFKHRDRRQRAGAAAAGASLGERPRNQVGELGELFDRIEKPDAVGSSTVSASAITLMSASCTVYYYLIAAVPALIAVATMKETARKPLA